MKLEEQRKNAVQHPRWLEAAHAAELEHYEKHGCYLSLERRQRVVDEFCRANPQTCDMVVNCATCVRGDSLARLDGGDFFTVERALLASFRQGLQATRRREPTRPR